MTRLKQSSKRNLLIGFGCSLLILILSSAVSYISINQLLDSQRDVDHTVEIESNLNGLISRMKDAETGQRGFLLTGEETFLEPYNGARDEIGDYVTKIQLLTVDQALHQSDLAELERLIDTKFNLIDNSIKNKKRGIPPAVAALTFGKRVMDSLRTVSAKMIKRENQVMISKNKRMSGFVAFTPIMIGIAALLAMGITLLFYLRVNRDARIALDLQLELKNKEEKTVRQIAVIEGIAKKIAGGDYNARVDRADLE